jgi:cyclophilin family peptidyl-prolyl cis-trans isomerase
MTGKRKGLVIVLMAVLLAGGAAAFFLKDSLLSGTEGYVAGTDEDIGSPSEIAQPPEGEQNMSEYDLTPDAEGLSKAVATMTLEQGGEVKWRFYTNDAPNTVKRITQLISEGFYNGIIFHRVVPGFVVQAGDPTGTGTSGSGVKLKAEFNHHKHVPGIVSMARTQDPNSADSQFFIMLGSAPNLDGSYTAFGKVVQGYEHVQAIRQGDKIKSFTIE